VPDWPVVAAGFPADEPVVVVHANRVVAASASARAVGVAVGLRRREAQGRCAEAVVIPADPSRDARVFDPLVAALDVVAPRLEVRRPGELALATRGPSRYHGGDEALAARVAEVLAGVLGGGAPVHVGVADGAFAATCAARPEARPGVERSDGRGPASTVVAPGATPAFLAPWPVTVAAAHLDLVEAEEAAGVLARLGIRTLGALAGLPGPDVLARFGPEGALLHRLARGLDPRPLAARRPAPELAVVAELDPPVERVDVLAFRAVALADQLHAGLARDGLACLRLGIEVETEHGEQRRRSWRHEGGLTAAAVAERARWQLDGWLSGPVVDRPTAGVTRLRLDPEEVVAARGRQLGFWGGETRIDEGAARALARVAALLGTEAVTVPEVQGGRSPGDRVALVPAAAVDLSSRSLERPGTDGPWPGRLPPPSPALVFADPQPVELGAADGTPVVVDGRGAISAPPTRLGRRAVVGWAGPWPADERWWDPSRARRRARVQVVLDDGTAHLLALEGGRWHLEATYD
jgi:protein ImuB